MTNYTQTEMLDKVSIAAATCGVSVYGLIGVIFILVIVKVIFSL